MKRPPLTQTVIQTIPTQFDPVARRYVQTWARIAGTGVLVLIAAEEIPNG